MTEVGYAAAAVLASLFLAAAGAKLARPAETAGSFAALGLPGAPVLSRAVPAGEMIIAAALLARPRVGGVGAIVALLAFSAVLSRAVRAGVAAPCGCFGAGRAAPVSSVELVRNGMLVLLAVAALGAGRPAVPSLGAIVTVSLAVVSGVMVVALVDLGRHVGGAFDNSGALGAGSQP